MTLISKKSAFIALLLMIAFVALLSPAPSIQAADHGDAPAADEDRPADIDDVFAFLDPNDNTKVVIEATLYGFIVPGEAVNFGAFDPNVRYLFGIETTGDARPDLFIDVRFSKRTATNAPQIATIVLPFGDTFTAPTTPPNLAPTAPTPVVTTDAATGASFFAGVTDDPFFFDIPGFNRFVSSVLAGSPDASQLQRGRDSFAGYNVQSIALRIPTSYFRIQPTVGNPGANQIGVNLSTQRNRKQVFSRDEGGFVGSGGFQTIDRMGVPAVNVALIPFARKDEYNQASTSDDAQGRFAGSIIGTLQALGTDATSIGILADVAVVRGDFLRLSFAVPNSGPGGGNNPEAAFPNGRRLGDDTIDTILFLVNNRRPLSDNANANDVPRRDTFPFFGAAQQPRDSGDDNTKN